ncbi:YqjD family protein [Saccharospirillum sp.]|uniref:YqjD family protein n=1 Tax=Saccharospirillum sp. TaxID=2033801 RepID=UPI0034A09833
MTKQTSSDHSTTDRLSESAHESVDHIAKTAGKAEERIRHEAAYAQAHVKEAGQKTKERTEDTLQSISGFVRENPLMSVGLAFAAGSLLSALKRKP